MFKHYGRTDWYYVLKCEDTECCIGIEEAVTDVLRKARTALGNVCDATILPIPSYFSPEKTEVFKKLAGIADLFNPQFVQEHLALAYGFEAAASPFCIAHFSEAVFVMSLFEKENGKINEIKKFHLNLRNYFSVKTDFFDRIIDEATLPSDEG